MRQRPQTSNQRIAVPTANGVLAGHFGHCEHFTVFDVRDSKIVHSAIIQAPPHEPGVIPQWLSQQGANVIIAGGMGIRAQQIFSQVHGTNPAVVKVLFDPEAVQ